MESQPNKNDDWCFMLDVFGQRAYFNYKGRDVSKSNCGICFTYLFIVLVFWSIFYTGRDIVMRQEPSTVESERFFENPEELTISPETFNVAFGLQNPNGWGHYINESIYEIKAKFVVMQRKLNSEGKLEPTFQERKIELEPCRKEYLSSVKDTFEKQIQPSNLYCFTPGQNLVIKGKFEADTYQFIQMNYYPCNSTARSDCGTQAEIQTMLNSSYYAGYYTGLTVDPEDYDNPGKSFFDGRYTTFGENYFKEVTFYVKHVKINSDIGWMFSDERKLDLLQFGTYLEHVDFRDRDTFFQNVIRVDPITKFYSRRYIKLQDILSEVDGLITLAIIVLVVIIFPYIRMKFYQDLVNDIFDLKLYRKMEHNPSLKQGKSFLTKDLKTNQLRRRTRASQLFGSSKKLTLKSQGVLSSAHRHTYIKPEFFGTQLSSSQLNERQLQELASLGKPIITGNRLITEEQNLFQKDNPDSTFRQYSHDNLEQEYRQLGFDKKSSPEETQKQYVEQIKNQIHKKSDDSQQDQSTLNKTNLHKQSTNSREETNGGGIGSTNSDLKPQESQQQIQQEGKSRSSQGQRSGQGSGSGSGSSNQEESSNKNNVQILDDRNVSISGGSGSGRGGANSGGSVMPLGQSDRVLDMSSSLPPNVHSHSNPPENNLPARDQMIRPTLDSANSTPRQTEFDNKKSSTLENIDQLQKNNVPNTNQGSLDINIRKAQNQQTATADKKSTTTTTNKQPIRSDHINLSIQYDEAEEDEEDQSSVGGGDIELTHQPKSNVKSENIFNLTPIPSSIRYQQQPEQINLKGKNDLCSFTAQFPFDNDTDRSQINNTDRNDPNAKNNDQSGNTTVLRLAKNIEEYNRESIVLVKDQQKNQVTSDNKGVSDSLKRDENQSQMIDSQLPQGKQASIYFPYNSDNQIFAMSQDDEEYIQDRITKSSDDKSPDMQVGLIDYMRSFFSSDPILKKKVEMLKEGEKRIRERLDVFNVIQKMREIDKLKAILLDQDQLAIFNSLPKPVLERKSREVIRERLGTNSANLSMGTFIQRSKSDQLFDSFKKIRNKINKTELDERLLEIYLDMVD